MHNRNIRWMCSFSAGMGLRKRRLLAGVLALIAITSLAYGLVGTSLGGTPDRIQSLAFIDSGDHFTAYFILVDAEGKEMSAGGTVSLGVYDDLLVRLYATTFAIASGEFSGYEDRPGTRILAYVWNIPFSLIARSDSRNDTLTADLTFACQGISLTKRSESVPFPDLLRAPNKAPSPDLQAPPSGWSKVAVELNASGSRDPNLDQIGYYWSFGDGNGGEYGNVVRHVYEAPGRFTISLTLLDGHGGESTIERSIDIRNPEKLSVETYGWRSEWGGEEHAWDFNLNLTVWNTAPVDVRTFPVNFTVETEDGGEYQVDEVEGDIPNELSPGEEVRCSLFFNISASERPERIVYDGRVSAWIGAARNNLTVTFFDVGQGDAILIVTPDSRTVLIDSGPEEAASDLVDMLHAMTNGTLDAFIATHPDSDHIGGSDEVLDEFDVLSVYHPGYHKDTAAYESFIAAAEAEGCPIYTDDVIDPGDLISVGETIELQVLNINASASDSNGASIVLRMTFEEVTFLFAADIDFDVENEMTSNDSIDVESDILKVAHHGSRYATSDAFLTASSPVVGVISVGEDNPYGHPAPETLARLDSIGASVYRTDLNGTITITTDGMTWEIGEEGTVPAAVGNGTAPITIDHESDSSERVDPDAEIDS
ncbi:MAG: MBL fold metallo-hydrolase, partial [Euryarchaeota archaeon]|nr:MBL fold metallo-hydrolase [Euryarchaeota archaeon]